jgi:hypothetical protein
VNRYVTWGVKRSAERVASFFGRVKKRETSGVVDATVSRDVRCENENAETPRSARGRSEREKEP